MMQHWRKIFILGMLSSLLFLSDLPLLNFQILQYSAYGASVRCSVCRKKISGKYMKNNKGQIFCSKRCLYKTLPKCSVCGKVSKFSNGKKSFCSQKCLQSTWPMCTACKKRVRGGILRGWDRKFLCKVCANRPKCFSCYQPSAAKFADGRYICKVCQKTAVSDPVKIIKIAEEVRKLMKDKLSLNTDHKINYKIVSLKELQGQTEHDHQGIELGLYKFEQVIEKVTSTRSFMGEKATETQEFIKDESHSIYFLYGIPENKLREVAAHELAHDWMQEFYPEITDLKTKEGWAEFIAAKVNTVYGRSQMNIRMLKNPDKIYGEGYRMIKKASEKNDPEAVFKFLEQSK